MDRAASPLKEFAATASFDHVNAVCRAFADARAEPSQLSIEDYLQRVADGAQPTLLRNLLDLDIQRRRAAGENPRADEYLARLPEFADLVRQAFLDLSSHSLGTRSIAAAVGSTWDAPKAMPTVAARRLGEYELLRELGRGGMGTVYEAVHLRRGDRLALKTLPAVDGSRLHRFKREFRALADVNHPNLVGLGTLEADGCHWFFTMDLIEGTDFLSYVRPHSDTAASSGNRRQPGPRTKGERADIERLRSALAQLVGAVMALHGQHIIHRDLKPSNVMVASDGRTVVLDFGLVMESDAHGANATAGRIEGTPRYMSPEQAAGESVTAAADWYAMGVMLYEALAGHPPFEGPVLTILQDKQRLDAPPLPSDTTVPEDLAQLAMRLLARDPLARPDAREIAKAISLQPSVPAAVHATRSTLVGRQSQLQALSEAHRQVVTGQRPLTVFIRGRSGEGKTALAECFLGTLRGSPASPTILSGRCYDRESVPFKALDSLIDALCGHLRSLDKTEAALMLPDDVGLLAQLFPVLERVEVVAHAPRSRSGELDEQQVRTRAFAALRQLLNKLSSRRPVVLFCDDLQWGDAGSAEALFAVLRPPEAPAVLLLGSFRGDEWEQSPFRLEWENVQRKNGVTVEHRELTVSPLSADDCQALVVSLLGRDSEIIRRRSAEIHAETAGNPFLLIELVGCFDPDTDSFRPVPMTEAVRQKLTRLPSGAEALLDVVAVSGQALPLADVSTAAGHDVPALATITHMRTERLVRLIGSHDEPLIDTYHDRIRETVLEQMEPTKRQELHLSLARVIEAGEIPNGLAAAIERDDVVETEKNFARVFDVAFHFDAGGAQRQAFSYGLLAAEQARRQFAPEVAAQQYAIAERNSAGVSAGLRLRVAEGSGESLMRLGRYREAGTAFDAAAELTHDDQQLARIETLQGELAFKQGEVDKSIVCYEQALRRLGNWVPARFGGIVLGAVREAVKQCSQSLFPGRLHQKTSSIQSVSSIHVFNRLTETLAFQNTPKLVWSHLATMNRVEPRRYSPHLAYSCGVHSAFMAMLGWQGRSRRFGERSIALAESFDDLFTRGRVYSYCGIGNYASARYDDGLAHVSAAIQAFEKAGDLWQTHLARFHKGCCHFGLGQLRQAVAEARAIFASSARIGDSRTLCSSWLWARATEGDFPFDELRSCFPCRPDDVMSTVHGMMAEGLWHSHQGRSQESLEAFARAAAVVKRTLCINSHMIVVMPMLAGALRRRADALVATDARQANKLRRRALRTARWAARVTRLFPAAHPLSLRELSLALSASGKHRRALKAAQRSCAVAERQAAKYEYAQSQVVRAQVRQKLGLPDADDEWRAARAALDEIEQTARAES